MEQSCPGDVNALFNDLVTKGWEKANKRQKLKAKREHDKKGILTLVDELRKKDK